MVTSVNNSSSTTQITGNATLRQIKIDLAAALVAAGVTDAKPTDAFPKGFPAGQAARGSTPSQPAVSWNEAFKMVSVKDPDNPGKMKISPELLKTNLGATEKLKALGVVSLSRFPRGTSVSGALDGLYKNLSNGILAGKFSQLGIYDLSAFPTGTNTYQAFKLIEDPDSPGDISVDRYNEYKAAFSALKSMGITTLENFPRGTGVLDAKALLEPKATQMLAMVGVDKSVFKDPNISALSAIAILTRLPDTLRDMASLPPKPADAPENTSMSEILAAEASAAKKLVAMGYESLAPFAAMTAFATEPPTAVTAFATLKKSPPPADLPVPTGDNTERRFLPTPATKKRSFGQPNPVTSSVYSALPSEKVTMVKTFPATKILTAAEVLAFNQQYWNPKPPQ